MYSWRKLRTAVALLALCGSLVGATGCYTSFANIQALLQASGNAVISTAATSIFGDVGTDFTNVVLNPSVTFVQSLWGNYLSSSIPQDLPNNTVTQR